MADNKPIIKLGSIQEQLQKLKTKTAVCKMTDTDAEVLLSPLIEAAAVLGLFEPEAIQPVPGADGVTVPDDQMRYEMIACCDPVLTRPRQEEELPNNIFFCLQKPVRRKALQQLISAGRLPDALKANSELIYNSGEPLQQMLTAVLTGKLPPLAALQPEQLRGLRQVEDWLSGIGSMELPGMKEIDRHLEMMEMLLPFKHLTGSYRGGSFKEFFRGRQSELARLRKYVGVAPPQGAYEKISRVVSHYLEAVTSLKKKPPLLITGMGGAGKSTLLAKFILSHAEAHEEERFPFVYIDFDRPNISAMEPETLLVEAARQLAVQYADEQAFCKAAREFYTTWNKENLLLEDTAYSETFRVKSFRTTQQQHKTRQSIQTAFIELFSLFPKSKRRPFLLVLDTFEEVQYKGEVYIAQLYHFMEQLQSQYPLLRTVVAGRAPVTQFKTEQLELSNLDQEAAKSFLEHACNTDAATAQVIVSKVGGNPLTLKLAAEFVNAEGVSALADPSLKKAPYHGYGKKLSEIERQGILYRRILDHIHNPKVLKLANPGLVLRYITPRLIQEVLNKPCGLEIDSAYAAEELFEETAREVSLVTRIAANTLQHRADIRKVMLRLMIQDDPAQVARINTLAVKFYQKETSLAAKAEEFYHRLCLDQPARELDKHWADGMQQFLAGITDELPLRAQTYLVARTGNGHLDNDVWALAEDEVKKRWATRRAGDLLNAGLAPEAFQLISNALSLFSGNIGILPVLLVRSLVELKRNKEAVTEIRSILENKPDPAIKPYKPALTSLLKALLKEQQEDKDDQDNDDDLPHDQGYDMIFNL